MPPLQRTAKRFRPGIVAGVMTVLLCTALASVHSQAIGRMPATSERLGMMLNAYRDQSALDRIPLSQQLQRVAEAHVADLERSRPAGQCNLHSWSANGDWTPCCYTRDHALAPCMWRKPHELTAGSYRANGYEIACWHPVRMTPEIAMSCWQGSAAHDNVVRNRAAWQRIRWRAVGAAISDHYAVVWFGEQDDSTQRRPPES